MKIILRFLLLTVVAGSSLLAVPRFALMEDVNCVSCHSFQGGGAGRAQYGKDYIRESLVMKDIAYPWVNEDSEFPVYIGFDTRYEIVVNNGEDLRHFPMQLSLYAGAEFGSAIAHAEVNRIIGEYRVTGGLRYEGLPLESSVSVAHELPIMGWRIDDHTLFSRGGNFVPVGLQREGLPYTPFIEPPTLLELDSAPIIGLEFSLMIGTAFLDQTEIAESGVFTASKISYSYSGDLFSAQTGLAYLREGELSNAVASWGVASNGFVWLGEVSQITNWPQENLSNIALLHQVSYRVIQGVDLIARYEYFDQDKDLLTGSIQRSSFGFELFPIPGIELKLSYRHSQLDLPDETPDSQGQFIGQVHFFM